MRRRRPERAPAHGGAAAAPEPGTSKLLDTSVAIDHLRGLPEAFELFSSLVEADELLLLKARRALQYDVFI